MPLTERNSEFTAQNLALLHRESIGGPVRALREIVTHFGFVSDSDIKIVADVFNISRAEVRGIVSFYTDLRTIPPATNIVRICQGESCQSVGSRELTAKFQVRVEEINKSRDANYVEHTPVVCLGLCPCGPAVLVNDELVANCSDPTTILARLS